MLNLIQNIFKSKPRWQTSNFKYQVEKAFTLGGIDYFSCTDFINIPSERAFEAMSFYNELDMKVDKTFLQGHTSAIESIINSGTIQISKIAQLNQDLKNRLDLVYDPDLLYKLASVVFFDEKEDPTRYDKEYNRLKILKWKKAGLDAFFLNIPLNKLLPSLDFSKLDSATFTEMTTVLNSLKKEHIEKILSLIKSNKKDEEIAKLLQLQIEGLQI
jgi:hypothetical protein